MRTRSGTSRCRAGCARCGIPPWTWCVRASLPWKTSRVSSSKNKSSCKWFLALRRQATLPDSITINPLRATGAGFLFPPEAVACVLFCHPERSEGSRRPERRDPSVATLPQDDMCGEIESLPGRPPYLKNSYIYLSFFRISPFQHLFTIERAPMQRKTIVILVIVGVILFIGLSFVAWATGMYNSLVKMDESVNQAWAQVQNQYQRRLDLIPNLVETVKGYAAHESQVFTDVAEARARVWRRGGGGSGERESSSPRGSPGAPRKRRETPDDSRDFEQPADLPAVPGGAGRAHFGALPAPCRRGELSPAESKREFPPAPVATRGDRKPDRHGASQVQRGGAGL